MSGAKDSQRNLFAAMSYILFLFIVPMFFGKKDAFLQFHMRQGFVMFVCGTIVSFLIYLPIIGLMLPAITIFVSLYAAHQAFEGKTWRIPVIASFADKVDL